MRVLRRTSKVLLVDEHRRVLLFSGIDRTKPEISPWWFAVGGALEAGETFPQAAIREVHEETGLSLPRVGEVVFEKRFSWVFEGREYDQLEKFFLVRTTTFEPDSKHWTDVERATMQGHRWWPVDELRTTDEVFYPEDLPDLLDELLGSPDIHRTDDSR